MSALFPLESNPEVLTKFIHVLGVSEKWNLVDVFGLDPEALAWVPRPTLALILLFPCSEKFYEHAEKQKEQLSKDGQIVVPELFYMKQYVSNACGTIALIHCIANNLDKIEIKEGSFKNILAQAKDLNPEEKGKLILDLPKDSEAFQLLNTHQELALEGQTELNLNEKVNHHFIAFVEKGGFLYELDGRKEFPINHGKTSPETFVEDAAKVCKEFIERDNNDPNFTVMALTQAETDQ